MLIKKICLSNFKNFENVEVVLNNMNVIVGANAAGKSNFIKALKFIKDIQKFGIDNAISMIGGIEYLKNIQSKENNTIIEVEFQPKGGRVIQVLDNKDLIVAEFSSIIYTIEIGIKRSKKYEIRREEFFYKTEIKYLEHNREEKKITEKSLANYDFLLSSKKGKIKFTNPVKDSLSIILANEATFVLDKSKITPLPVSVDFLNNDSQLKVDEEHTKSLLERFSFLIPNNLLDYTIYDFDLKKAKESTLITGKTELEDNGENLAIVLKNIFEKAETKRQFSNLLADMLPFISDLSVDKFYDKSLLFKIKEVYHTGANIPSSLLSDGTISITAIIAALFFEDNQLVIIEEPEQGIHPALIAKLMQFFYGASHKKQIIITTHSPEIVKHTQDFNDLLLVSRGTNGCAKISKPFEQEMVKTFLDNELGIDTLFTQNLLDF